MIQIDNQLITQLENAVRKTNAHINSGYFNKDERDIENVFVNFVKKEVQPVQLGKFNYLFKKQVKPHSIQIWTSSNKIICIRFKVNKSFPNYTQEMVDFMNEHVGKVNFLALSREFDNESFSKQCENCINRIEGVSFEEADSILTLIKKKDELLTEIQKAEDSLQLAATRKKEEFLKNLQKLELFYKQRMTV